MGKENDLLEAARTGNVVTIGKLLSRGSGRSVISAALSFRRALGPNCQDTSGYTPLHHAVLNGHRDAVQMLLKFDASPTVPDNRGSNPLHLAAWTGNVEIVQTLLTVGVSKDQVNEQNNYWDTPLHFAAQYGHTDVVSILLEHGADPTLCNRKEEGPLDLAAQYGRQDTVQLLVRLRPDLLDKIPDSRSLLHLAAKNGHHRIVKLLLEAGCDINKTTKTGTALHEAAVFGKIDVVRVLLECRPAIDVEIEDGHSETALQKIESHSSKVSQEISKMIMAHIRGEPLPKPVESNPSTPLMDGSDTDPNLAYSYVSGSGSNPSVLPNTGLVASGFEIIDHANIYDNVPEDRSALYARHYQTHAELRSSSPEGILKRGSSKPNRSSPDQEVYMNVNQINQPLARLMPPKKPQRNSIGILLDQAMNGNSPQLERKQDQQRSASPMHLDVRGPHSRQSNTLSSQDSDCPPPLPDRNYYDMDQAGEYTQLRRDALPPKQQQQPSQQHDSPHQKARHPHPPQQPPPPPQQQLQRDQQYSTVTPLQDYDIMNEGLSSTSTEASSDDTHGSLYETLSNAQSGIATPDVPYPPYEIGSKPPHPQVQLHIHESHDDNDMNSTGDGEYQLNDEEDIDAYEFLSDAVTGKGNPKPKPRITPTSSSSSSVPSTDSASFSQSKPKPLPRRNKPVPAKRSPGSMSSQPSTPSEELTSSSDQWGGPSDRPTTPDQPPPSPNTAMMGIRAKLGASEVRYSDYDNPVELTPCAYTNGKQKPSNTIFFPSETPRTQTQAPSVVRDSSDASNGTKPLSGGQLRKLELDLANRSRKFHEFEAAADQLQTRLEKWQAHVEESHLNRINEQENPDHDHGDIYENVYHRNDNTRFSYDEPRRLYENPTVLNGNHQRVLTRQNSSPSSPSQTRRSISPRKPKRALNTQLSLNISPTGYDNPSTCFPSSDASQRTYQEQDYEDDCPSPTGYDNPLEITREQSVYENAPPRNSEDNGIQESCEPPIVPEVIRQDEHLPLDNKFLEANSESDILKPDASHPFAGSIRSRFSGLIYGSNRGSRTFSLTHQDRFSRLHPGRERSGALAGRMSVMNGTLVDGLGKTKGDEPVVGSLDDSSEWDQIESIMNSFGAGLVRESVYIRDYQQDFERMFDGPGRPQSVGAWLDSLNLGQYENMLIANGFDHLDFIGGGIIEEQDLMDIGIVEEIHRRMILEATKCLPIMKPIGPGPDFTPKPASVSDWLRSLLLSDYISNFLENNITTMDRALELWEFELENVLEVPMLGHRKRILASLGDRRRSRHSSTIDIEISRPHSLDIDITSSEDLVRPPTLKNPSSCENLLSVGDTTSTPPRQTFDVKPSTGRDSVKSKDKAVATKVLTSSKTSDGAIAPRVSTNRASSRTKDRPVVPKASTPGQELQIESFVGPEEREEMKRHTSQSSSLDIDLFKDYSKEVASPTRNSTSSTIPEEGALHPSEEEEFRTLIETTEQYARQNGDCASFKRTNERRMVEKEVKEGQNGKENEKGNGVPPQKKQGDTPGSQWMHPPDALIKGCCNYTSSYLGSSIIKELHGTESTREACTRLRRSAQHLQKMPAITLSINYGGVKFIDSKSKMVITEHEICNISCVAQDSNDLKTFAYITKDIQYEKLYCHVFTVKTVDLATEIIMTLGQAFEIAYKMLLKTTKGPADTPHNQPPIRANQIQAVRDEDASDTASYEDTKL